MSGNLLPPGSSPGNSLEVRDTADLAAAPAAPLPAFAEEEPGLDLSRYIAAIKRFRWLIVLVIVGGTTLGVVGTRFVKPEYTVTSTIWIDTPTGGSDRAAIRNEGVVEGQNWVQLLTTNVVLDSVVVREKLYLEPGDVKDTTLFKTFEAKWPWLPGGFTLAVDKAGRSWTLRTSTGMTLDAGAVGSPVGAKYGMIWTPPAALLKPGLETDFKLLSPRDASTALQKQLVANLAQEGNFLLMRLNGADPARLTRTLNALGDQFVTVAGQLKRDKLSQYTKYLGGQVATLGDSLRNADARLEQFKVRTITQPSEGTAIAPGIGLTQPTVMTDFFDKRVKLEQIKQDRARLEQVMARAGSGALVVDELQTIQAVQGAPDLSGALKDLSTAEQELRALRLRYTDQSRNVQDAQARVTTLRNQTIPTYLHALDAALGQQASALQGQITAASRDLQAIPARTITEQRLERDRDATAALFLNAQTQYQAARLAEASAIPDVRVLDPAVQPQEPTKNRALMIIFGALVGSTGLAVALALLLDRLDKRFRYPDQVTRELGLGILGAIPAIRQAQGGTRDPEEAAQVVEAFRTIRMNLTHSYGAAGPVMLTVSSPSPGDGKSLVSSNLALSFAEAGYRTLLVDGDIRRGELHRMFAVDRRPGLLDCLSGQTALESIVRPTSHRNLSLIPCGTRHHHGPELLVSTAMRELMAALKTRYNVIIVDSPPLGAGIDPFVLGTATGNMLVVLRSGETDRQMAEAKLKAIDRLPIRLLGAVLNDISNSDPAYRYYRYAYGYTADEDVAGELQPASTPGAS